MSTRPLAGGELTSFRGLPSGVKSTEPGFPGVLGGGVVSTAGELVLDGDESGGLERCDGRLWFSCCVLRGGGANGLGRGAGSV